jgi:hypothetical protein
LQLELDVYDWDAVGTGQYGGCFKGLKVTPWTGKRDFIGDVSIPVVDMSEAITNKWFTIIGPSQTQKGLKK